MIEQLRKRVRRGLASFLYYSGILWVIARVRFRRSGFILTYHRVLPEGVDTFSSDGIVVRPRTFERHMAFLKRHFRVLSLDDLEQSLVGGKPLPPNSCVVTFDDGWEDNFEHALPILERHKVPAICFLATGYVDSSTCFWQERLARLFSKAVSLGGPARSFVEEWLPSGVGVIAASEQRTVIRERIDRMKDLPLADVSAIEDQLLRLLGRSDQNTQDHGVDRFMTWSQVRRLSQDSVVAIGCHGVTHTPLTALDEERAKEEVCGSRDVITTNTGALVKAIAYPNGNVNERVIDVTRAAGYVLGFTTAKGVFRKSDDPLRLPRINIHESGASTMPEFLSAILLVFQRLRRSATAKLPDARPGY